MQAIREKLKGYKTYIMAVTIGLYLLGVWLEFWPYDEKVLALIGAGGLSALAAKINRLIGSSNA